MSNRVSNSTWRFVYQGPEGTDICVIETNDKSIFDELLRFVAKKIISDGMIFKPNKDENDV